MIQPYNRSLMIVNPNEKMQIFEEIAERLSALMCPLFAEVQISKEINHTDGMVNFILNPHSIVLKEEDKNDQCFYIAWDLTNAVSSGEHARRNYGAADVLAIDVEPKRVCLQTKHKNIRLLPFTCDMISRSVMPTKNIDICMIGAPTSNRTDILKECREKGYKTFSSKQGIYGLQRNMIIARSKIMLDIPRARQGWAFFPGVRACLAFNHGCLLISTGLRYQDQVPYSMMFTKPEHILKIADYYLNNEEDRLALVTKAYKIYSRERLYTYLQPILEEFLGSPK